MCGVCSGIRQHFIYVCLRVCLGVVYTYYIHIGCKGARNIVLGCVQDVFNIFLRVVQGFVCDLLFLLRFALRMWCSIILGLFKVARGRCLWSPFALMG